MLAAPQIIRGHSTVRPLLVPECTGWSPSSLKREGESLTSLLASTLQLCSCHLSKAFGKTRPTGKQQRAERSRPDLLSITQHPTGTVIPCTTSMSCLWFPIRCSLPSEKPISLQPVDFKPLDKLLFSHVMNRQNFQSVTESRPAKTRSDSLIHEREIRQFLFLIQTAEQSRVCGMRLLGEIWDAGHKQMLGMEMKTVAAGSVFPLGIESLVMSFQWGLINTFSAGFLKL